jgi:hypothetical protein
MAVEGATIRARRLTVDCPMRRASTTWCPWIQKPIRVVVRLHGKQPRIVRTPRRNLFVRDEVQITLDGSPSAELSSMSLT